MRESVVPGAGALLAAIVLLAGCFGQAADPETEGPGGRLERSAPAAQSRGAQPRPDATATMKESDSMSENPKEGTELATFGAGCFWCVEAVLEQIDGVLDVASGYMGGHVANPTYEQVCSGTTGHAEVVQVRFDPKRIRYEQLLELFWKLHDPTTLNRQGNDVGTQYRSVIFYHSEAQKSAAEASRRAEEVSGTFAGPIVTEIAPAGPFYPAEDYHQDYYRANRSQPYCRFVIRPKLEKLGLEE
jgi:peptide-methionine (S)-S-oxide reductase